jgi:hypothetical protein
LTPTVVSDPGSPRHHAGLTADSLSVSVARLKIVALSAAYFGAFAWIYIAYVSDRYEYFGFGYDADWPLYDIIYVSLLCLTPSLWIPGAFERPSSVFIYFQYFLIYIPAVWMTRHSALPVLNPPDQVLLSLALAASMAIILWVYHRVPLVRINSIRVDGRLLWSGVYVIAAVLLVALVGQLGGNFHLVGLADIYAVRQDATDLIEASGNIFVNYAFTWLNALVLPMIFARAVSRSRYLELFGVTACYIFLFGIWGAKTSLFSPLILIVASIWASRGASRMPQLMVAAFIIVLLVPAMLPFEDGLGGLIKFWWIGIVDMRTFAIPGLSISQYFDFFSNHPLTLGSHVTGLNWFIQYPYDLDIPRTIGYYFYGHELTANASFWAQDGLASLGVVGIVIVTFFAAFIMWLLDSAAQGLESRFVITSLIGTIVSFTNTSLFTTLLTSGLGLFIIACVLMPRDGQLTARGQDAGY